MCSIVFTTKQDHLDALVKASSYRGGHSWSFSIVDLVSMTLTHLEKGFGPLPDHKLQGVCQKGLAVMCHQQSPTTLDKEFDNIHPSVIGNPDEPASYLWHNGVLHQRAGDLLQYGNKDEYNPILDGTTVWDTALLHEILQGIMRGSDNWHALGKLKGSFACIFLNEFDKGPGVYFFRNDAAPMYYLFDKMDFTFSSIKYDDFGLKKLRSNQVYHLNYEPPHLISGVPLSSFEGYCPFFFAE